MVWVILAGDLRVGGIWPDQPIRQAYRGRSLLLLPGDERRLASVNIEQADGESHMEAATVLNRFISAVTWGVGPLLSRRVRGGGSTPGGLGRGPNDRPFIAPLHPKSGPLWAPEPQHPDAAVCLARYAAALETLHSAFSYLLLYQVLEGLRGGLQSAVSRHLDEVRRRIGTRDWRFQGVLQLAGTELVKHFATARRNSIAHAKTGRRKDPSSQLDPDDFGQMAPIAADREVVKTFAEVALERDLGIERHPPEQWAPVWRPAPRDERGIAEEAIRKG